jgi:hypothetical protein
MYGSLCKKHTRCQPSVTYIFFNKNIFADTITELDINIQPKGHSCTYCAKTYVYIIRINWHLLARPAEKTAIGQTSRRCLS